MKNKRVPFAYASQPKRGERSWGSAIGLCVALSCGIGLFWGQDNPAVGGGVAFGGLLAALHAYVGYWALRRFFLRADRVSLRAVLWNMAARFLGVVLGIALAVQVGRLSVEALLTSFLIAYVGLKIGEVRILGRTIGPPPKTENGV
ncbi:MAG: hypothetical protein N2561_08980 [Bacteroidetes bacterium]|nr:hypothetical protein [Rhodothermia bacterium]MCS7154403.1 hypothetical protein [Bacteroidota bacterium]MCX7907648.1 hypothetical protein [Bacteroidota bacterium]MDW8137777.1 hypothetical protein [Bacteroidota bacterium]MDW8286372.1 hypothetical protein [Bacteroidota bacterium]